MLSEEVYERLAERLVKRIDETNLMIINNIAATIKKIGTLTPTQAQQLANIIMYGGDYQKIVKQIAKINKENIKDIKKIFEEVAKQNQEFSRVFYEIKNVPFIPYDENTALKKQVDAFATITAREYANLTRTRAIGYILKDKDKHIVFEELGDLYKDVLDRAVLSVGQGKETYNQVMSSIMKDIGKSGLRSIDFESGYNRRLDSQVRMNLLGGLRDMSNHIQEEFGKEYGADGVEVSVHEYPAPDHAQVQGRQLSHEEYEKLQETGKATTYDKMKINMHLHRKDGSEYETFRPISNYNCYHNVFQIVLGVSEPIYSNKELSKILQDNEKGFELNGKHYTMYEGTQMQRQLETRIREQKDILSMAQTSDDKDLIQSTEKKIRQLTKQYKDFSNQAGLPVKMARLKVSGYKRVALKK